MVTSHHTVDRHGQPDGGLASAPGLLIAWDTATVQSVITVAADRLEFCHGAAPSPEVGEALGHLYAALEALGAAQ